MNKPIYLDYNATTPIDPAVLDAMLPYLRESFGNASSSSHSYGWEASQAIEKARLQVTKLISAPPDNTSQSTSKTTHSRTVIPKTVIWTSGATESNNLALLGVLKTYLFNNPLNKKEKAHLITTQVEHKAILEVAAALEKIGLEVTYLAPDKFGRITPKQVQSALKPYTRLISIIMGQNEIGTINPIGDIGAVAKEHNVLFHVDGAQTVGKLPIDVNEMNIDLLSASGHKLYAPKGTGFLYARAGLELTPLMYGGSQEYGLRPGTVNVASVVALGAACEICFNKMSEETARLTHLRDQFIQRVLEQVPSARLNGHPTERLCSNVSFSFEGLSPDVFALGLSGLAISSGSACTSGAPSHVLAAIGMPPSLANATIRFGIGRFTTQQDLDIAAEKIVSMTKKYSQSR